METLYPGPRMGSALCHLPKATVGADGFSSSLPRFSREDVESLSDEAPALSACWFISHGQESSGNKKEWLSSLSFDELHLALRYQLEMGKLQENTNLTRQLREKSAPANVCKEGHIPWDYVNLL